MQVAPRALPVLTAVPTNTAALLDFTIDYDEDGAGPAVMDEDELFAHQTRALPDIVPVAVRPPQVPGESTVTERLDSNRRERHEVAVEEMHQDLDALRIETEATIAETAIEFREELAADEEAVLALFVPIEDDSSVSMAVEEVDELGRMVAERSAPREAIIDELVEMLTGIEGERAYRATAILKSYGKLLIAIAYKLAPEVERMIVEEARLVNVSLVANRKQTADLEGRLLTMEVVRDRKVQNYWLERKNAWIVLKKNVLLAEFYADAERSRARVSKNLDAEWDVLQRGLDASSRSRDNLMDTVSNIVPGEQQAYADPESAASDWVSGLEGFHVALHTVQQKCVERLAQTAIDERQNGYAKLRQCQIDLVRAGACSAAEVRDFVAAHCAPVVETQLAYLDTIVDEMGAAIGMQEETRATATHTISPMLQRLTAIWLESERVFEQGAETLRNDLDVVRNSLDESQNSSESEIDSLVDALRQAPTQDALAADWTHAQQMFEDGTTAFADFQTNAHSRVNQHPATTARLYADYQQQVCAQLGVEGPLPSDFEPTDDDVCFIAGTDAFRVIPTRKPVPPKDVTEETIEEEKEDGDANEDDATPAASNADDTATLVSAEASSVDGAEPTTDGSTVAEAPASAAEEASPAPANATAADTAATPTLPTPPPTKSIIGSTVANLAAAALGAEMVANAMTMIRQAWLEHVVAFEREIAASSESTVVHELGFIDSEHAMHLHLHESRLVRIQHDVHNVRAAEFQLHRERIAGHCEGMDAALLDEKKRFDQVTRTQDGKTKEVAERMLAFKVQVPKCESVKQLSDLKNEAFRVSNGFKETTRSSLRHQRQMIEECLRKLRESNGFLRTSLRTFSEGGNFSTAEIDEFRVVLKMLGQQVDDTEGVILKVLNGMEVSQVNVAEEGMRAVEDLFKAHIKDVELIEQVRKLLNNGQVQVRGAVADDNAQAAELDSRLHALQASLDSTIEGPDAEQAAADAVAATLRARVVRLSALKPTEAEIAAVQAALAPPDEKVPPAGGAATLGSKLNKQTAGRSKSSSKSETAIQRRKSRLPPKGGTTAGAQILADWSDDAPVEGSFVGDVHAIRMKCRAAILEQLVQPYFDGLRGRSPTRSGQIADSIQPFMAGVEDKLLAVHTKAVSYRKQCVIEYGDQVKLAATLISRHADGVFDALATEVSTAMTIDLKAPQKDHHQVVEAWLEKAGELELSLRPALGHPNNSAELAAMCDAEQKSQDDFTAFIDAHFVAVGEIIAAQARRADATLRQFRGDLFATLDLAVLPSEVLHLPNEKKKSLKRLLREQMRGGGGGVPAPSSTIAGDASPTAAVDSADAVAVATTAGIASDARVERKSHEWAPRPNTVLEAPFFAEQMLVVHLSCISSTTITHSAADKCFLAACDSFESQTQTIVAELAEQRTRELGAVKNAKERWDFAVDTVKAPFIV